MSNVAFLGLGVMGFPMAGHLAKNGHKVTVYNRSSAKAEQWARDYDGHVASTPDAAVGSAEIIFTCLGDDPDVAAVIETASPALASGSIVVDHTTASPALARQLHAQLAKANVGFLDAPVSGGQAGAENGKLAIMCGGDDAHFETVRPVMTAYGARIVHIGAAGAGQLCKSVNQICIAGLLQGLSEGVHFAAKADLDIEKVLEAISGGAAQSWQMENRAKTMAKDEFGFGFAVDWMRKDLRIALAEARENGARLPITATVDQFYGDVQAMGGGRWDTSSLVRRLKDTD